MRVQDAVKQAQKKLGLSARQPDLPANSLLELWNQSVTDANQSPAFTCLGQTLSYGEVDQLSRRVASYFQKQLKLVAGDRIAVQLPNLIQYPVVVIAAWKLGLVVVNTNPMYTVRELVHQFNDANVKAVVVLDAFYDTLCEAMPDTNIEHVVVTRPIDLIPQPRHGLLRVAMTLMGKRPSLPKGNWIAFPELLTGSSNYSVHRAKPEDVVALQYTGGTTGASKGVMLTQNTLMSNICKAAKDEGIIIFAVAMGEGDDIDSTAMSNCASSPSGHYFETSGDELVEIFEAIADQITDLRLTL